LKYKVLSIYIQTNSFNKITMRTEPGPNVNDRPLFGYTISWLFGAAFLAIGSINIFWGNDPGYGIFIVLLSSIYFQPVNAFLRNISGIWLPLIVKIILGLFILWTAMGVGELFDKIGLMIKDIKG
jgi:hypothetical protein